MAKQDDYVRYTIRVPADLYARLQRAAGEKSVNAEIVAALEAAFPAPKRTKLDEFIEQQERMLAPLGDREPHPTADPSAVNTIINLKLMLAYAKAERDAGRNDDAALERFWDEYERGKDGLLRPKRKARK